MAGVITGSILLLFGLTMWFLGWRRGLARNTAKVRCLPAVAEILERENLTGVSGYLYHVEFTTADGQQIRTKTWPRQAGVRDAGDQMPIRYEPDKPTEAYFDHPDDIGGPPGRNVILPAAVFVFGGLFLALGSIPDL
ncbi:DUF3592 domain-containing protein [Cryptosporangium aurantiacum]|uniref:DUF3592 domain-containing protein n=1 Tax=Cryptosporangium aurantiacum TaxID=134849 RepID=A0A1M7N5M0_9ACTN|nr:DUF3592 domain-containing protein [Cryptosporangium aurantiacum]SHM98786.1 Protein of unknown function [Cryptosporangium aurantiacum]